MIGKISSSSDVENVHVTNKTQKEFTISDKIGVFKIKAKLNDTVSFSSVLHQPKNIVATKSIYDSKIVYLTLEALINVLDEVVVGKILTGNLRSDIENVDGKAPINFFDVGIPGYTGKIATQSERRLSQAGQFKPIMLLGILAGGASLDPIINEISGRTKILEKRVDHEERESLMRQIKSRLARGFFSSNSLGDSMKMDFFYFCADDKNFIKHCKNKTNFEILTFLKMKYKQYQANLNSNKV
ncbi:hypothetical protein GSB9_02885 [Flavobacteriaceae bacterium GSB9]|nr:hypothetical protein GSB9_02885 [Flavobacteriaceae bacterium GSB9]